MDLETSQTNATTKLPILKQGEYEMWRLRIEQYFQVQDYALWDVIENGNSFKPVARTIANADGTSTSTIPGPVTTEEKAQKKNDVKARSMLLMALPNEHLLTFSQYKDAKTLFEAIQARFGGNDATKKTQKTLLKQMYENFNAPSTESLDSIFNRLQKIVSQLAILGENISQEDLNLKFLRSLPSEWNTHVVVWRNKPDLDTMSFDDLYNNFKIVEQEVKRTVTTSSSSGSQNMAFVSSPGSTNEVDTANIQVSTTTTPVSTASTHDNTANLSDATVYVFLANQPNGSQLVHEDLEQIHEDDLEEIDLKWQLALLSMRARRHIFNAMVAMMERLIWSLWQYEESPYPHWLYGFLRLRDTYKRGLASVEEQLIFYKKNEVMLCDQIAVLKIDASFIESENNALNIQIEKLKKEKESNQIKIDNFENASKSLDKLIGSQIFDNRRKGEGFAYYNAVAPLPTGLFAPPTIDLSNSRLEEFQQPKFEGYRVKIGFLIVMRMVSDCDEDDSEVMVLKSDNVQHKPEQANQARKGDPQFDLKDIGIFDSGFSRHMTGNKSYLTDYQDYDGEFVTFAGSSKGELKFNLFSVSQICDMKNNVLFTETECLILFPDFKIPDESQVMLKVPRKNNMYSFDLKNVVPSKGLTCLFAKATNDESKLWHRRLGHINFKTMNKLVKGNLVRGLPSKIFENDHSCVACQKGKQHKASSERKNRTLIEAARTMLADSLLPIPFWAEAVNTAMLLLIRVLLTKPYNKTPYELLIGRTPIISFMRPFGCLVTILNTLDHLGKFDGKADEGVLVGYSINSKTFKSYIIVELGVSDGNRTNGYQSKINSDAGPTGKEKEVESLPKDDAGKKATKQPTCYEGGKTNDLGRLDQQVKSKDDAGNINSANSINTASLTVNVVGDKYGKFQSTNYELVFSILIIVNAASSSFGHPGALEDHFKMTNLEDTGIFDDAYDDRDEGAEADYNPIPSTRANKDHPKDQIIREMQPKKVTQALDDESWVEAMQEELLQFKLLNVWTLVDLPYGKKAIGTKWVFRNKKDQRIGLKQSGDFWHVLFIGFPVYVCVLDGCEE
ncbi:putative ribonuclease H-like domain-containing protein [Tanacetum coccineum]